MIWPFIPVAVLALAALGYLFYEEFPWQSFRRKTEADPVLPSELDDWDTELEQATGKTMWQIRCEANPELLKSAVDLSSAQNNPSPYHNLLAAGQISIHVQPSLLAQAANQQASLLQQQHHQQMMAAQMNVDHSQFHGLLSGLGNIGGLFNGQRPS